MMSRGKHFLVTERHNVGSSSLIETDIFIETFIKLVLQKYHCFPDISELLKTGLPKGFIISFLHLVRTSQPCRK